MEHQIPCPQHSSIESTRDVDPTGQEDVKWISAVTDEIDDRVINHVVCNNTENG